MMLPTKPREGMKHFSDLFHHYECLNLLLDVEQIYFVQFKFIRKAALDEIALSYPGSCVNLDLNVYIRLYLDCVAAN